MLGASLTIYDKLILEKVIELVKLFNLINELIAALWDYCFEIMDRFKIVRSLN